MQGKTDPINSLRSEPSAAAADVRMPRFTSSAGAAAAAADAAVGVRLVVVEPKMEIETEQKEDQGEGEEGINSTVGRNEKGKMMVWQNRLPDPVSRKAIEYYRDPAHRGYLSYQVGQGQGPSLFFKRPRPPAEELASEPVPNSTGTIKTSAATPTKSKKGQAVANRIW